MRILSLISTIALLFCRQQAVAQSRATQMAQLMQTYHNYNMFDGAVLVADNGKVVYKGAFGMANREWQVPNTTDTKFMIGSISKPITALLTLIQVQKGWLQLNKTLADYLPVFKGKPAGKVTIKQMLSHTSGIPNYDIIKDFFPRISRQHFEREDYIGIYADSALSFEPGTRYQYSSWGYFTLGYLLEKISGKTYAQLMKQDIFDPLGMRNSGSYHHQQVVPKRATGYDYTVNGYSSADFRDQSNTMGTGDLYSTVEDLFTLHLAIHNHKLLNAQLTAEMLAPGMAPANYGYGWFNKYFKYTPADSVFSNFHLGRTDGFISFLRRVPSTNTLVVILCNSSPTDFFGITDNLLKLLRNHPIALKQPMHKVMEQWIATQGATNAVSNYQKVKKDTARYYTDWIAMNFLAEQLLTLKRYEDALLIAENNAAEFNDKDLIMFTLGNAYEALNRNEEAMKYYQKALAITPGYEEARSRLKQLRGAKQ
jgi:CubicO group peptidase (beta-lactamase class C family)